jgi:uncharacterized membrane protein YoaK (UPF0700 family)
MVCRWRTSRFPLGLTMQGYKLVLAGGCLLAFAASTTNVAFLLETGTSVSHMTGDITRLATDLSVPHSGNSADVLQVGFAALGFVVGAMAAGFFIHHPQWEAGRPYGRSVILIGSLFVASHFLLGTWDWLAAGLAAFACGFQNSLATRFRGLVLRTTHLTGLFTEFGVALGMRMKGHEVPAWKIMVPACIAVSFFLGAVIGAFAAGRWQVPLLLIAGVFYIVGGIVWSILKRSKFQWWGRDSQ